MDYISTGCLQEGVGYILTVLLTMSKDHMGLCPQPELVFCVFTCLLLTEWAFNFPENRNLTSQSFLLDDSTRHGLMARQFIPICLSIKVNDTLNAHTWNFQVQGSLFIYQLIFIKESRKEEKQSHKKGSG